MVTVRPTGRHTTPCAVHVIESAGPILIGRAGASTWPTIDFALALTRHAFIIRYELM